MTRHRRFYISIEVDYFDHRKTLEVGERLAYRHLKAVAWCHKNRTDGFLPRTAGLAIVFSQKAADQLVSAGLWELREGGWHIHDYLLHQESKESLDAAANAGRIGAAKRWGRGVGIATQTQTQNQTQGKVTTPYPRAAGEGVSR